MPISSDLRVWSLWTYRFLAETHDFWWEKNSSSGGSGSSVSQKPTRNSNRCSRVHAPATRVRSKPSFDRAVSGEDDRVPGGLSGPGGSWTALHVMRHKWLPEVLGVGTVHGSISKLSSHGLWTVIPWTLNRHPLDFESSSLESWTITPRVLSLKGDGPIGWGGNW